MSDLKAYPRRPQSVADGGKYPAGAGFGIGEERKSKYGSDGNAREKIVVCRSVERLKNQEKN